MENTVVTTNASSPSSLEKLLAERDADLAQITPGHESYEDSIKSTNIDAANSDSANLSGASVEKEPPPSPQAALPTEEQAPTPHAALPTKEQAPTPHAALPTKEQAPFVSATDPNCAFATFESSWLTSIIDDNSCEVKSETRNNIIFYLFESKTTVKSSVCLAIFNAASGTKMIKINNVLLPLMRFLTLEKCVQEGSDTCMTQGQESAKKCLELRRNIFHSDSTVCTFVDEETIVIHGVSVAMMMTIVSHLSQIYDESPVSNTESDDSEEEEEEVAEELYPSPNCFSRRRLQRRESTSLNQAITFGAGAGLLALALRYFIGC